jgi:hypothetical protein
MEGHKFVATLASLRVANRGPIANVQHDRVAVDMTARSEMVGAITGDVR